MSIFLCILAIWISFFNEMFVLVFSLFKKIFWVICLFVGILYIFRIWILCQIYVWQIDLPVCGNIFPLKSVILLKKKKKWHFYVIYQSYLLGLVLFLMSYFRNIYLSQDLKIFSSSFFLAVLFFTFTFGSVVHFYLIRLG